MAVSQWIRFSEPLTSADQGEPEPYIAAWLDHATRATGRPRAEVRVLDVGCGRGDRVAWLLEQGWDAYGADVEYVEQGDQWLAEQGHGEGRLRVIDDYRLPFDDIAPFDIVLSWQVLEHIPHFERFVAGIAAVSRTGTRGLHVCPGAWMPVETHMQLPFVHWLPKGPLRRAAIRAELALGLGRDHFADRPTKERAEIFANFSETEVFYRPPASQLAAFEKFDISATFADTVGAKLRAVKPGLPPRLATPLGAVYGRLRGCYISTTQMAPDPVGHGSPLSERNPRR